MIDLLSTYLVSLVVSLAMPSNFYPVLISVIHTNFAFISIGLLILYSCLTNCMVNSYCYCSSNYSAIFFCNPSHDVLLLQPHYTNSLGRNDWYLLFYQYWQVQDFSTLTITWTESITFCLIYILTLVLNFRRNRLIRV